MSNYNILVGTTKGLITYRYSAGRIEFIKAEFDGLDITAIESFPDGRLMVAIKHKHWGVKLFTQDDPDQKWKELKVPKFSKDHLTVKDNQAKLKQIWDIHHGGHQYPDRFWLATEPGALFITEDRGANYSLVESLWNHPSRIESNQWFGAGKDLPFVHSLHIDPKSPETLTLSVSCAGIFRTQDSGATWKMLNQGMQATYLPNPTPDAGYDPHHMIIHEADPTHIWQQNHCGIYRSEDGGDSWIDVSGLIGFPSYGFSIVGDESDPMKAWVIPVEDETSRIPPCRVLTVMTTSDGGETWEDNSNGLPKDPFFGIVLREAFYRMGGLMTFGTTNGNLYFSDNDGESWQEYSTSLAKVSYIRILKN